LLIINADDWGRSAAETDAALTCFRRGRITSVTAMMFMEDSERAADLAKENGVGVGLHLNLSQLYNYPRVSPSVAAVQERIVRFMKSSRFALLIYHPGLRRHFREVFQSQMAEFLRLYQKAPSHVDGHQHRHLCVNMLFDEIIPRGSKVRRNFTFWPGEKGIVNRHYRALVDKWLARKYLMTDFFFSLKQCLEAQRLVPAADLAKMASVELMTHPIRPDEQTWLMSDHFVETMQGIQMVPYALL
jgi:chitin disaccharide deacetylase